MMQSTSYNFPSTTSPWGVTLSIPAGQSIRDVNVNLALTHTFDGDLFIVLVAPDGTTVTLSNQNGGSGDNYTGTTFDDQAGTPNRVSNVIVGTPSRRAILRQHRPPTLNFPSGVPA